MDKDPETLDMVLDIPNTISLNPFDRPPNIMDDDLNSVTQEELEANLSTDCPTEGTLDVMETTNHQNANEMWEQLIQSVLEDTSTQDAVQQQDDVEIKQELLQQPEIEGDTEKEKVKVEEQQEEGEANKREDIEPENIPVQLEEPSMKWKQDEDNLNQTAEEQQEHIQVELEQHSVEWKTDEDNLNQNLEEERHEVEISTQVEKEIEKEVEKEVEEEVTFIKNEETVMDYSLEEEQMLSQHVMDNYYLDDLNNEDTQDDLCQVEVYASYQETEVTKEEEENPQVKNENSENEDDLMDDDRSDVSAVSLGHLEPNDGQEQERDVEENPNKPEDDKESQLSIIISDHCYSQEISIKVHETDVLKQNIINHMMSQKSAKDHHKIIKIVDRILNDIDNDKINKMLDYLNLNEIEDEITTEELPTEVMENQEEGEIEVHNDKPQEKEHLDEQAEKTAENEREKTLEDQIEKNLEDQIGRNLENLENPAENDISNDSPVLTETLVNANLPETSGTMNNVEQNINSLNENEEIISSSDNPKEMEIDNSIPLQTEIQQPLETSNLLNNEKENNLLEPSEDTDSTFKTPLNNAQDSIDTKSIIETFADNCSEPIEHNLFEEEFELLCKNGMLPIAKKETKTDLSIQLLEKLKDFVSNIQKDCLAFATVSTNIEEKLHDYIKQQYLQYQEIFKPYCYSTDKQTVETQTDFKRLTKRKRKTVKKESKKQTTKTSEHSTIYSSTSSSSPSSSSSSSSSDEEDNTLHKPVKKENSDNMANQDHQPELSQASVTLPSVVKSLPPCTTNPYITNYSQEYDDGINLSQYVQSEIFDIDTMSQQSLIPSDDSDSLKEDDDVPTINSHHSSYEEDKDDDSDDAIIFKIRPKKSKKLDESPPPPSESKKPRKSQSTAADNMSVNSESDKENLTSDRKDKKSNDSMDEEEKNDREIER